MTIATFVLIPLLVHFKFCGYVLLCAIPGLAMQAVQDRKLRFPVRPKMHSLEHLMLCTYK